jgi:phage/plasmid-associated DNA primase
MTNAPAVGPGRGVEVSSAKDCLSPTPVDSSRQSDIDDLPVLEFENTSDLRVDHDRENEAARVPVLSDEYLALKFAAKHADDLRFVDAWGKWFYWDKNVWREDTTRIARNRVRAVCREVAAGILSNKKKDARRICSNSVDGAVLTKATADRLFASTVAQWDSDPFLLNTPSGVVDLKNMKVRANRPADHLTKITAIAPGPYRLNRTVEAIPISRHQQ